MEKSSTNLCASGLAFFGWKRGNQRPQPALSLAVMRLGSQPSAATGTASATTVATRQHGASSALAGDEADVLILATATLARSDPLALSLALDLSHIISPVTRTSANETRAAEDMCILKLSPLPSPLLPCSTYGNILGVRCL